MNRVKHSIAGYLLIEILVAVMVLTFAVAGLATLQNKTIQQTVDSKGHMSAMIILKDVQDRIQINAAKVDQYNRSDLTGSSSISANDPLAAADLKEIVDNLKEFEQSLKIDTSNADAQIPTVTLELTDLESSESHTLDFILDRHFLGESDE